MAMLTPGDPAPLFVATTASRPDFLFDTVGGRWIVLSFYGSAGDAEGRQMLDLLKRHRSLFDDETMAFFGVSVDPEDLGRVTDLIPGIRFFRDFGFAISDLYGVARGEGRRREFTRRTFVLDPALRIAKVIEFRDAGSHIAELIASIEALPAIDDYAGTPIHAPVLMVPGVFEPELCRRLIALYDDTGGEDSGFMRTSLDGRTVGVLDHSFKRRSDVFIRDEGRKAELRDRLVRNLVPDIRRYLGYSVTRVERYLIACYDGGSGGFFFPHRDNTSPGTAHRRFAVTINLNAEEFEGGDLCFPEYGRRTYRASTGGAVVFSCSLLHEARPVTAGRRFAFLPFLYDDGAAGIRERNAHLIVGPTTAASVDARQD